MIPKAIIFDFDGVIADTEPIHFKAFKKLLEEKGVLLTREEYYSKYLAYDDKTFFKRVLEDNNKPSSGIIINDLIIRKSKIIDVLFEDEVELFPGFIDFVKKLGDKCKLAIGSGALMREVEFLLEKFDIRYLFQDITTADFVDKCKPDPEVFETVLENLNKLSDEKIESGECLVIEDSIYGIEAAKSAGMKCLAITNSYPHEKLSKADLIIESFLGLNLDSIKKIF